MGPVLAIILGWGVVFVVAAWVIVHLQRRRRRRERERAEVEQTERARSLKSLAATDYSKFTRRKS